MSECSTLRPYARTHHSLLTTYCSPLSAHHALITHPLALPLTAHPPAPLTHRLTPHRSLTHRSLTHRSLTHHSLTHHSPTPHDSHRRLSTPATTPSAACRNASSWASLSSSARASSIYSSACLSLRCQRLPPSSSRRLQSGLPPVDAPRGGCSKLVGADGGRDRAWRRAATISMRGWHRGLHHTAKGRCDRPRCMEP